jgi:FG-GAP repeat protein
MRLIHHLAALALFTSPLFAGNASFVQRLDGSAVAPDSDSGWAVSLDGDSAVVGAPGENAVYVYERVAGVWSEVARLQGSNTGSSDAFGESVDLEGDLLAVGAGNAGSFGTAYLFRRVAGVWTEIDILTPSNGSGFIAAFGAAVAVSDDGERVAVGDPFAASGGFLRGAVYVYSDPLGGDDFSDEQIVLSNDLADSDFFGRGVDIEGDLLAASADLDDDNGDASGSAYVFRFNGTAWLEEEKLKPSDGVAGDQFGLFLDFDGNRLAVSSTAADIGGVNDAGAIYTFLYSGGSWAQEDKISSSLPIVNGQFGSDLALDGSLMIAGEAGANAPVAVAGTVHEIRLSAGVWTDVSDTTANGGTLADWYGFSLDLDETTFIGGAPGDAMFGNNAGAAFIQKFGELFATICYGDGSLTSCPCANNSTLGNREGCMNSQGLGAVLAASGSASVATDNLVFAVSQARGGQPGIFVQGTVLISAPFKDGILCMGNPTERLEVIFLSATGTGNSVESVVTNGNVSPGQTRHYQFWYRDPVISPCGTGSNFTSGLTVDWL